MSLDFRLLRELEGAEARHDESRVRDILAQLIAQRLKLRLQGTVKGLSRNDYALLSKFAAHLERKGQFAEAMNIHLAVATHAQLQKDIYGSAFFALRIAHCATSCLDREQSSQALSAALYGIWEPLPENPLHSIAAAGSLSPPRANFSDLATLRTLALYVLARHLAAWGDLTAAAIAVEKCLDQLIIQPNPYLHTHEVALFAFEIAIDRGEFDRAGAYRQRFAAHVDDSLRTRWDLAEAYVHRLRGELSHAEQLAAKVFARSRSSDPETVTAALSLRADVLGLLNRLDDAESVLSGLAADEEGARLRQLIDARRSLELDAILPYKDESPSSLPQASSAATATFPTRKSPRIRHDWIRALQRLQLAIHHGALNVAAGELAFLIEWSESIHSPLVVAERESAWAKVALALGDLESATMHAENASTQFRALKMPLHEREACLVRVEAFTRMDPRPDDKVETCLTRAGELITYVESKLTQYDRRLFRLNKWNALDREMQRWCTSIEGATSAQLRRLLVQIDTKRRNADGDHSPPWPLSLPWILSLPRRKAVVYFVTLPEWLHVFVLHRGRCTALSRHIGRAALWELSAQTVLELDYRFRPGVPKECETTARALGWPGILETLPPSVDELAIVPDDVLVNMPFAALTINGQTLSQHGYAISIVPSPRWDQHRVQPLAIITRGAAFGVYRTAVLKQRDLPHAASQVRAVAAAFNERVQAFVGKDAEAAHILEQLQVAQLAHFVCHGEVDEQTNFQAALAVSDRWLTIADLEPLDLKRLQLALLESCWSGGTKVMPGREMIGIPMKLLERGCKMVIAGLRPLNDQASARFASEFYGAAKVDDPVRAFADLQRRWTAVRPPREWAFLNIYLPGIAPAWPARMYLRIRAAVGRAAAAIQQ